MLQGGGVHLIDEDLDAHIHESGFGFKQVKLQLPKALFKTRFWFETSSRTPPSLPLPVAPPQESA